MIIDNVLVPDVLNDDGSGMISGCSLAEGETYALFFGHALDDGLESGLDVVHPLVVLVDDGLPLDAYLLARVRLPVDLVLLPLEPLLQLPDPLVLVELVHLVLEHTRVRALPLTPTHLLVTRKSLLDLHLQALLVLFQFGGMIVLGRNA